MSNDAVRAGYHENCILKRLVLILMSLNGYCQEHVSVLDQKNIFKKIEEANERTHNDNSSDHGRITWSQK